MMGWQWHQLDHMQIICTSLQTNNHASTSPVSFYKRDNKQYIANISETYDQEVVGATPGQGANA